MVRALTQNMFDSLTAFEVKEFFITVTNQYFPLGSFWWIIGLALFAVVHLKTKNLAYSGMVAVVYFLGISESGLIENVVSQFAMRLLILVIGASVGYYLYRSVRSQQ